MSPVAPHCRQLPLSRRLQAADVIPVLHRALYPVSRQHFTLPTQRSSGDSRLYSGIPGWPGGPWPINSAFGASVALVQGNRAIIGQAAQARSDYSCEQLSKILVQLAQFSLTDGRHFAPRSTMAQVISFWHSMVSMVTMRRLVPPSQYFAPLPGRPFAFLRWIQV